MVTPSPSSLNRDVLWLWSQRLFTPAPTFISAKDLDLGELERRLGAKTEAGLRSLVIALHKEALYRKGCVPWCLPWYLPWYMPCSLPLMVQSHGHAGGCMWG